MSCEGVLRYQCAGLCPRHARSGRPANPGLDVRPHWPVAITTMVTLLAAKPVLIPTAPAIPLAAPPSVLRRYDTVHHHAAQAVPRGPLFGSGRTAFAGWGCYGLKIPGTPPGRDIAHDALSLRLGLNNRPVRPSDDAPRDRVKRLGHGHFPSSNERKIRMLVRRRQTWLTMA